MLYRIILLLLLINILFINCGFKESVESYSNLNDEKLRGIENKRIFNENIELEGKI